MPSAMSIDQLPDFIRGLAGEMDAAARVAGDEAIKTSRAWVIAYARNRKALGQPSRIKKALKNIKPRRSAHFADMRWELRVLPIDMPMAAYPHSAVPGLNGGVRVEINKGAPELVKHAFLARVKGVSRAGEVSIGQHIFVRERQSSLPIRKLFTSSVADVLHDGLAHREIQDRAQEVFGETFARVMENGVAKKLAAKWAAKRR
jgi:hypothetical protein